MPTLRLIAALLAGTFLLADAALAQDEEREVIYRERTEIDFESVDVSSNLVRPEGRLLMETKRASFNPLIRFRENFDTEMRQSVNEVK